MEIGKDQGLVDVYPALTYRDVKAALTWLETAFGLEPRNNHELLHRGTDARAPVAVVHVLDSRPVTWAVGQ